MTMRMSDYLKADFLGINVPLTSSALESIPIRVADAKDYMVVADIGTWSTVGAKGPLNMYLQAATASTGTYTTIASGITMQTSGATLYNMSEVRIKMAGAQASGAAQTIVIDGVTITKSSGANNTAATAAAFKSSGATVCVLNLETVIPAVCTNLECTRFTTVATACEVRVYPKNAGYVFDAQSTTLPEATSAKIGIYGGRKLFKYDFTAADIAGKNSSYTHVKIGMTSTLSSIVPFNMVLIRDGVRQMPDYTGPTRSKFSTVSSAHST